MLSKLEFMVQDECVKSSDGSVLLLFSRICTPLTSPCFVFSCSPILAFPGLVGQ